MASPDKNLAANYLAASERYELERRAMPAGPFGRTLAIAAAVWLGLVVLSGGNGYAIGFGWIVGIAVAVAVPSVGRWTSGRPAVDPNDPDVFEAAAIEERRLSMIGRGRYATDAELLQQARERSISHGREFPGSND